MEECECEWDDATRGAGIYERLLVVAGEEDVADEGGRGEAGRVWGGMHNQKCKLFACAQMQAKHRSTPRVTRCTIELGTGPNPHTKSIHQKH